VFEESALNDELSGDYGKRHDKFRRYCARHVMVRCAARVDLQLG